MILLWQRVMGQGVGAFGISARLERLEASEGLGWGELEVMSIGGKGGDGAIGSLCVWKEVAGKCASRMKVQFLNRSIV